MVNNEPVVEVCCTGICRTDLELTRGYMDFKGILGHEFVGRVLSETNSIPQGTRVVGEINAGCGECAMCRKNLQRHCQNRTVLGILNRNGCMAERVSLPEQNLLPVPDTVPDERAVFSEPLAAALEIFEQIHIPPDLRVCIIGDGKLGLLIAMTFAFKHEGETTLIGHHQQKLDVVSDLVQVRMESEISAAEQKQWDIVVEATGNSGGLALAMQLVRPRGVICLKSTMAQAEALDLTPLVIDEIQVVGSRCGQLASALRFLERHPVPVEPDRWGLFHSGCGRHGNMRSGVERRKFC